MLGRVLLAVGILGVVALELSFSHVVEINGVAPMVGLVAMLFWAVSRHDGNLWIVVIVASLIDAVTVDVFGVYLLAMLWTVVLAQQVALALFSRPSWFVYVAVAIIGTLVFSLCYLAGDWVVSLVVGEGVRAIGSEFAILTLQQVAIQAGVNGALMLAFLPLLRFFSRFVDLYR